MIKKTALGVFILFIIGALQAGGVFSAVRVKQGEAIQPFGLPLLVEKEDKKKSPSVWLDDFIGKKAKQETKLLLLTFFASWCEPCKKEFPIIKQWQETYGDEGFDVLMVNIDMEAEGIKAAQAYIAKQKPSFPVVSDRFNIVVRRLFDNDINLPASLFISPEGKIVRVMNGADDKALAEMESFIKKSLNFDGKRKKN